MAKKVYTKKQKRMNTIIIIVVLISLFTYSYFFNPEIKKTSKLYYIVFSEKSDSIPIYNNAEAITKIDNLRSGSKIVPLDIVENHKMITFRQIEYKKNGEKRQGWVLNKFVLSQIKDN